jgi:hypothetical protein
MPVQVLSGDGQQSQASPLLGASTSLLRNLWRRTGVGRMYLDVVTWGKATKQCSAIHTGHTQNSAPLQLQCWYETKNPNTKSKSGLNADQEILVPGDSSAACAVGTCCARAASAGLSRRRRQGLVIETKHERANEKKYRQQCHLPNSKTHSTRIACSPHRLSSADATQGPGHTLLCYDGQATRNHLRVGKQAYTNSLHKIPSGARQAPKGGPKAQQAPSI